MCELPILKKCPTGHFCASPTFTQKTDFSIRTEKFRHILAFTNADALIMPMEHLDCSALKSAAFGQLKSLSMLHKSVVYFILSKGRLRYQIH